MQHRTFLAVTFLLVAACSEGEKPALESAASPESASVSEPEAPAPAATPASDALAGISLVTVKDRTVQLVNGMVKLDIPKGWSEVADTGDEFEIEADRYKADLDRWARCQVRAVTMPNLRGRTQKETNTEFEKMPSQIQDDMRESGMLKNSSFRMVDGVQVSSMRIEDEMVVTEIRQLMLIAGFWAVGIFVDCDVAKPATKTDTREVAGFLDSLTIAQR